jgi:ATP-dependent Lon protease
MDRMETIDIAGYTDHDKLAIAEKYLVPRQLSENGLKKKQAKFLKTGLRKINENYTREAGVREYERQIGSVCRAIAARVAKGETDPDATTKIDEEEARTILGPEKHVRELDVKTDVPGVVVGLAYTAAGGDILFIEAAAYPGKGNVHLTGQIGEVMKESADAAFSLFKSRAVDLDYDVGQLKDLDVHIHVPAGAVPKDGPSAGVAMFTAVASLLLKKKVKDRVAMTGEITLRGKVLPIGGLNEKSLAAARAGIKTILIPRQNERDLEEVNPKVKKALKFVPVESVDEVLDHALSVKSR